MSKEKVQSESKFLFKVIISILLTPYVFIQVLRKKKKMRELLNPFRELTSFLIQPKFTLLMLLVNILLFYVSLFFSEAVRDALINFPSNIFSVNIYTIITSGFLHASPVHLWGNMIALFIFGRVVERRLGFLKTGLVYFGALILSNVFFSLIHVFMIGDNVPGLGASGAIMGLIATAILLDPFYITHELFPFSMPVMVIGWLVIWADISGILNPVDDGIGHFAHLGGFLSIALLNFLLGVEDRKRLLKGLAINLISLVVWAVLIRFVLVG